MSLAKGIFTAFRGQSGSISADAIANIESQFVVAECSPSDCDSCSEKYPSSLSIDTSAPLWGSVKPWRHHILCATGKTDWIRDVTEEKDSLAQAIDKSQSLWAVPKENAVILSTSLAPPEEYFEWQESDSTRPSLALILPEFVFLENITPDSAGRDIAKVMKSFAETRQEMSINEKNNSATKENIPMISPSLLDQLALAPSLTTVTPAKELAYVLLCSHRTRDKRCAITSKILQKTFYTHLTELDLYRDASDDRPGGVKVICVSHVGGHKYAANVIIYTKSGHAIWLARVKPVHIKSIIDNCILKGMVFPELLRGAFNSNPISW